MRKQVTSNKKKHLLSHRQDQTELTN